MASETDISVLVEKFEDFYSLVLSDKIEKLLSEYPAQKSLYVDYEKLEKYDKDLADMLIRTPDLVIPAAEKALISSKGVAYSIANPETKFEPHVRFINLPESGLLIQDISSRQIRELVTIKGVISKRGPVLHKVKIAVYKCQLCDAQMKVFMTKNVQVPQVCAECKRKALKLEEDSSYFVDIQYSEAQELLERLKGGSPAATIDLWLEDDLVNKLTPGESVIITGIMRLRMQQRSKSKSDTEQIYNRYIDVVSITKTYKDFEEIETTKEDIQLIEELSKDPKIYEKVRDSIARGIYGHMEVKEALSLQLFGGTPGKTMKGGNPIRDDMHILLIGDPGSAKTRFLQSIQLLAPKGIYVSGKSVTGVGLTASAEKDEMSEGGWTLKAGALVIASGGIACIDEFDKIDDHERSAMHEVMESQTVSVAKAGIVAKFKAKTAILAAANPKFGRFDPNKLPGEQFDIPPTILSRFDLIFPIIDVLDEEKDSALAKHILEMHQLSAKAIQKQEEIQEEAELIDPVLLRKYIAYARQNVRPVLSDEAVERIKSFYVELRKRGKSEGAVPITPRQIEGLVRMAEASAKIRLSDKVEIADAERAIRLTNYVLDKVSRDKETGKLDIDILATGKPKSQVDKINTILDIARSLQAESGVIEIKRLIEEAHQRGIDEITAHRIVEDLIHKGEFYKVKAGVVKFVDQVE
ncbi:MAG: minichromosome maintenance protein MCM [Candidatus Anstonellaceae archaeon]